MILILLLLLVLDSLGKLAFQVKSRWEQSGNGSGERAPDSDDIASDTERTLIDGPE